MSLSEEIPQKQPVFSSCDASIKGKECERQEIERKTKEFLRKKKNSIKDIPSSCHKLDGEGWE